MESGAQVAVTKCDNCPENIGTKFCYECHSYLCQPCESFHQKFPATRQHSVVNAEDIDKLVVNNKHACEDHKQDYSLFCTTCDVLICTLCATNQHNGHNFKSLSDVETKARASLEGDILLFKEKKNNIYSLVEDIKFNKLKTIADNSDIYIQQERKTSKNLSEMVESVSQKDITRVTDHYLLQQKQMEETLSELERLSRVSSSLLEKGGKILSVEHDVTFILSQKALAKELTQIDIPGVDEIKLVEKFSEEHFVESLIEHIQNNYKLRGQKELESKVSALQDEITVLKNKGKMLQAEVEAESEAKEKMHTEKETCLKHLNQLQIDYRLLQFQAQSSYFQYLANGFR